MHKVAVPLTQSWYVAVRSTSCWETRETQRFNDRPKKRIQYTKSATGPRRRIERGLPAAGLSIGPVGLVWQVFDERSLNIQSLDHYQMRAASVNQTELMDPELLKPLVGLLLQRGASARPAFLCLP